MIKNRRRTKTTKKKSRLTNNNSIKLFLRSEKTFANHLVCGEAEEFFVKIVGIVCLEVTLDLLKDSELDQFDFFRKIDKIFSEANTNKEIDLGIKTLSESLRKSVVDNYNKSEIVETN